jgi:hypothetical protein
MWAFRGFRREQLHCGHKNRNSDIVARDSKIFCVLQLVGQDLSQAAGHDSR